MSYTTKQKIEIDRYSLDGKIVGVIEYLQKLLEGVPEQHRASAVMDVSIGYSYGDGFVEVEAYFDRPETPEEISVREQRRKDSDKRQADAEREQYEKLKRKFGS